METNADRKEGGFYVWEGGLKEGERRHMKVYCRQGETFQDANMVEWAPVSDSPREKKSLDPAASIFILLCTGYIGYQAAWEGLVCQRPGDSGAGEGVPADMGDMADAPVPVRLCLCLRPVQEAEERAVAKRIFLLYTAEESSLKPKGSALEPFTWKRRERREGMRAEERSMRGGGNFAKARASADGLRQSKSGVLPMHFLTEDAVVKIFTEPGGAGFQKESWFYRNICPSYAPKLLGAREGLPGSGTDKRKRPGFAHGGI